METWRREYQIFRIEVTDSCKSSCGCWEARGDFWISKCNKFKKWHSIRHPKDCLIIFHSYTIYYCIILLYLCCPMYKFYSHFFRLSSKPDLINPQHQSRIINFFHILSDLVLSVKIFPRQKEHTSIYPRYGIHNRPKYT